MFWIDLGNAMRMQGDTMQSIWNYFLFNICNFFQYAAWKAAKWYKHWDQRNNFFCTSK